MDIQGQLNVAGLQDLIKKLKKVEKFVYLVVDNDRVSSKVHLPAKDAVKIVSVDRRDIFITEAPMAGSIKVAIYDADKAMNILKHFIKSDTVNFSLEYGEVGGELIAEGISISNSELTIRIECADPTLGFVNMTDEEVKRAFQGDNPMFTFNLDSERLKNLADLFTLDKQEEAVKIQQDQSGVHIIGKSYNQLVFAQPGPAIQFVKAHKKFFDLLDDETYTIQVYDSRILLESQFSETSLLFATVIDD